MTHVPLISVTPRDEEENRILDRIASNYAGLSVSSFFVTDNVNTHGPQLATGESGSSQPPRTLTGFSFEEDGEDDDHLTPLQRLRLICFCALHIEGGRSHA